MARFAPTSCTCRFGFLTRTGRVALTLLAAALFAPPGLAAAEPASRASTEAPDRLPVLAFTIQSQLERGQRSRSEFSAYLRELEALRAAQKDPRSPETGQIQILAATILISVFEECGRALEIARELKSLYPDGVQFEIASGLEKGAEHCALLKGNRQKLIGQPAPALEFEWASRAGLTSLGQATGKVMVLDFWANTSPSSVAMFPLVRRLQERFRALDVEIVGVTHAQGSIVGLKSMPLDFRGKPDREMRQMPAYMKAKEMDWTVAFARSPDYLETYGVAGYPSMAIVAPDGTVRHAGFDAEISFITRAEMIDRILAEFGRPTSGLNR